MDNIIRIKSGKDFTIIPNIVFKSGLSYRAIGLLTFILHLPDDWKLHKTYLYKTSPEDGRTAINTAWEELEKAGFIYSEIKKSKNNKLHEINYIVYDSPQKDVDFKHVENQQGGNVDFKHSENKHSQNEQLIKTNQKKTNKQIIVNTTVLTAPVEEAPKVSEKKEGNPLFKNFISVYDTWYKNRNDGIPPKMDGANGSAAKSLIGHFKNIVKARAAKDNVILDEKSEIEKVLDSWTLVLNGWDGIEPFYQDKTRLIDINSNIQNIINQIKNGYRAKQQFGKNAKIESSDVRTMFDKVDAAFK